MAHRIPLTLSVITVKECFETVTYSGGFYNKEWFKKEVLNLSEAAAMRRIPITVEKSMILISK